LHLHVDDDEIAQRMASLQRSPHSPTRGYAKLYVEHVMQADCGADLDFLVGGSGAAVPRDNH
jgi:dihydroxy-acid dehydratase